MNDTKTYLQYLAKVMHRDFYSDVKQWEVSDHEMTIISQLDNMYVGIKERLFEAESELSVAICIIEESGVDYNELKEGRS